MTLTVEKRRRGILDWVTLTIFLGWNALMAWLTHGIMSRTATMVSALPVDQPTVADVGIGVAFISIPVV
jgi:hypothetical protein